MDRTEREIKGAEKIKEITTELICVGRSNGYYHQPITGEVTINVYGIRIGDEVVHTELTVIIDSPNFNHPPSPEMEVIDTDSGLGGWVYTLVVQFPSWDKRDPEADIWCLYLDAKTPKGRERGEGWDPKEATPRPMPEIGRTTF